MSASVDVLLCTLDGGSYLREQLDSLGAQSHRDWALYVADDGSRDNTLAVLADWRDTHSLGGRVHQRAGPGMGHARNFLNLLAEPALAGAYLAFCDQDDIWDGDKLARALAALAPVPDSQPALYCSRTRSVDADGREIGRSPLFARKPCFANALIQNVGGGNTMVMNAAARKLLLAAGPVDVVSHDWWAYLLVAGAGGEVIYDPEPTLSYRQHAGNAIGANTGPRRRAARYRGFLAGRNRDWNAGNLSALERVEQLLTEENRHCLAEFRRMREAGAIGRIAALRRGGFHAQTLSGNLGLVAATLLKKI